MEYYSLDEIKKHNKSDDCWLLANNKVYNVTNFIKKHPIGSYPIIFKAGQNCSEDYNFHCKKAQKIWDSYQIGYIEGYSKCCI